MGNKRTLEPAPGEQIELLDVGPENLKQIKPVARRYRSAVAARIAALEEETKLKAQILSMVHDAHLSRLDDGTIRFKCDGMTITITPRDELVRVKEEENGQEA